MLNKVVNILIYKTNWLNFGTGILSTLEELEAPDVVGVGGATWLIDDNLLVTRKLVHANQSLVYTLRLPQLAL